MEAHELDEKLVDLRKNLEDTFIDEIKVSAPEKLKEQIVQLSKRIEDIDMEKKKDQKLRALKSQTSDLNGGYRDTKKAVTKKLQYILLTLQERGSI